MNVLFCTEGNSEIGFGHVYRCLALAEELQRRGVTVLFDANSLTAHAERLVFARGFPRYAGAVKPSWDLVVEDEHVPRPVCGEQITLVDHTDDLEQSIPGPKVALLGTPQPGIYVGPQYAIIGWHIRNARPSPKQYDLTMCFGGSDPAGATWKVAEALQQSDLRVAVLLGPGFEDPDRFHRRYGHRFEVALVSNPAPMFLSSRVVMTSGGMTLWEALYLNAPPVVVCQTAREMSRARQVAAAGLCVNLGLAADLTSTQIAETVHGLLANQPKRKALSSQARWFVDGRGVERVADIVIALPAQRDDSSRAQDLRQDVGSKTVNRCP